MPKGDGETERRREKGPPFIARKGLGGVIGMVMRCNVVCRCENSDG